MPSSKCLFIARFQPPHRGHVHALRQAFRQFGRVTVAIGSSNESGTGKNPFTYGERRKMLMLVLKRFPKKWKIIPLPDYPEDLQWTDKVLSLRPDAVMSFNPWVSRCLGGKAAVKRPKMLDRRHLNSTRVRRLMRQGREWKHLVPKEVAQFIEANASSP